MSNTLPPSELDPNAPSSHNVTLSGQGFAWQPVGEGEFCDRFAYEFNRADGIRTRISVRIVAQDVGRVVPTVLPNSCGSASELLIARQRAASER